MDRMVKTDVDRRDKAYYARCINELKKWGAPLDGWRCIGVEDVREDDPEADLFECELCGCSNVRFVHVMDHDLYFEEVRVGCICAGVMEGDILKAQERERLMRNRARRRKNFIKREWKQTRPNLWERSYRGIELNIMKTENGYIVFTPSKTKRSYKGKPIRDFYSAIYAAFDLADPKEDIL